MIVEFVSFWVGRFPSLLFCLYFVDCLSFILCLNFMSLSLCYFQGRCCRILFYFLSLLPFLCGISFVRRVVGNIHCVGSMGCYSRLKPIAPLAGYSGHPKSSKREHVAPAQAITNFSLLLRWQGIVVTLSQVMPISSQAQSKSIVSQESECLWKTKALLMMKSSDYRVQYSFKSFLRPC
jgi:hypothetical protein